MFFISNNFLLSLFPKNFFRSPPCVHKWRKNKWKSIKIFLQLPLLRFWWRGGIRGLRSLRSRRPMGFMEEFSLAHPTHCHPRIIFFSIRNFLLFLIYSQGWRRLLCEGFRACSTFFISSLSLDCCNEGKLFHLQHFSSRMREAKSYEKLGNITGKRFPDEESSKKYLHDKWGRGKDS